MKKYQIAVFIGRFQPFHKGHYWEIEQALALAEKLIIGIGSSNLADDKNPYPANKRRIMIEKVIEKHRIGQRVLKIVELPDTTDTEWIANVKKIVQETGYKPEQVLVIGNNDWVNDLLKPEGFGVLSPGFYNRQELEGTKIRELMRKGDLDWEKRVPLETVEMLA